MIACGLSFCSAQIDPRWSLSDRLRIAAQYRLAQDYRVKDCAVKIMTLERINSAQEQRLTLRDSIIANNSRIIIARTNDANTANARAAKAERKVRNRTPWAWVGRIAVAVGAAVGIHSLFITP